MVEREPTIYVTVLVTVDCDLCWNTSKSMFNERIKLHLKERGILQMTRRY